MKSRSLFVLGVSVTALSLFAVACGDDDPAPAGPTPSKGGSAGSSAGSAGAAGAAAGSAGATAGGSAGATAGGSAGATAGGSAGATAGGSAGATAGGSAGATAGGSAGATAGGAAGASGGAGGATGGAGGGASGKKFGLVTLSQTVTEVIPGTKSFSILGIASFPTATSTAGTGTTCTQSTDGPCSINECTTAAGGAGGSAGAGGGAGAGGSGGAQPAFGNAGDITVTGLKTEVKLTYKDAATGYNFFSAQAALWDGGETGKFAAPGASEVPAFNGETTAPATIVLSKPAVPALGAKVPIDTAAAFDVAWDVDAKAKVTVSVTSIAADDSKTVTLSCPFDGAAKAGTVPASATAKLIKGGKGSILIGAGNTKVVPAGDFDVNLTLQNTVLSGLAEFK